MKEVSIMSSKKSFIVPKSVSRFLEEEFTSKKGTSPLNISATHLN